MFRKNIEYSKFNIDMHTHIIPELDDGSKSVEQSLEMLKREAEQGVSSVVLTPHFYAWENSPEEFLKRRSKKLENLLSELKNSGESVPKLSVGAEVLFFEGMGSCEALKNLAVLGTNYLLLEMPFSPWNKRTIEEVQKIKSFLKLIPIIAHIDRYMPLQPDKYIAELLKMDVLIQVNAEFFTERRTKRKALGFLEEGFVHFVGSDCHNTGDRAPNLEKASEIVSKKLGSEAVDYVNSRAAGFLYNLEYV